MSYAVWNELFMYAVFGGCGWLAGVVFYKIKNDKDDE